jgi:hypothetical protein
VRCGTCWWCKIDRIQTWWCCFIYSSAKGSNFYNRISRQICRCTTIASSCLWSCMIATILTKYVVLYILAYCAQKQVSSMTTVIYAFANEILWHFLLCFMLPLKNSLTAFYTKFMTLFDVFYDNLMRVFYARNSGFLACYNVDCSLCNVLHNFMLLYQFYAKTLSTTCTETFSTKLVRYSRRQLGSILCYVTDSEFTL